MLPNFYFAYQVFAGKVVTGMQIILRRFYRAEVIKLCLAAVVFVVAIKFFSIAVLVYLITFIVAQLTFWLAALIIYSKKR